MTGFRFGTASQGKLRDGLVPDLVRCAYYAIEVTEQDFCIWETKRAIERAIALQAAGASRKGADSLHVPNEAGEVHAVDGVPWIGGEPRWIEAPGLVMAKAWHRAVRKFDLPVIWGGVWDRPFAALDPTELDIAVEDYVARFRARKGRRPLVDIWHFEMPR